jgi:threonine/homoserine efflux transporter RhtA
MMQTAETSAESTSSNSNAPLNAVPVIALASTVACAAAGILLAYSLFPAKKRRLPISAQVALGALIACAGAVTWKKRQEEADAARHLVHHVHLVRDAHWLKKHPIAYG